ncbi:MAG: ATP-binding protein [Acidimicrobiia bacterium]
MSSERSPEVIELTFPASSSYVRLSRLAAAALAAELDFDVEAVDDLRIAVDEAVTLLVSGRHDAPITLRFLPSRTGIVIEGRCEGAEVDGFEVTDLVEAILSATADEHEVHAGPGGRRFRLVKFLNGGSGLDGDRDRFDGFGPDDLGDGGDGADGGADLE